MSRLIGYMTGANERDRDNVLLATVLGVLAAISDCESRDGFGLGIYD